MKFFYDISNDCFFDVGNKGLKNKIGITNAHVHYSRYIFDTIEQKNEIKKRLRCLPIEICIEITNYCNFSCPICIANAGINGRTFLPKESIYDVLENLKGQIKRVCITGGEPTLHPDIEEILKISTKNFPTILSSNGFHPNMMNNFSKKFKNIIFAFSLHGPKEIHDRFVGYSGSYEKVIASINNTTKNAAITHIYTTAVPQNIASIPKLIEIASNLKITEHRINTVKNKGRLIGDIKPTDLSQIIQKCQEFKNVKIQFDGFPYYLMRSNGSLEITDGYNKNQKV